MIGWAVGACCAAVALERGESRPFAMSMLVLNLLPLFAGLALIAVMFVR